MFFIKIYIKESYMNCYYTSIQMCGQYCILTPGSYTVTTTQDMKRQTTGQPTGQTTTQNNTGLEHNHTPKRPRLQDQNTTAFNFYRHYYTTNPQRQKA